MHPAFRTRARRYREWDRSLAHDTRFFGAASIISAALHGAWPCRLLFPAAQEFLIELGRELEHLNVEVARRMACDRTPAFTSDAELVHMEQTCVERRLASLRRSAPAYHGKLVEELDRMLVLLRYSAVGRTSARAVLKRVVSSLRSSLQRPLQFARQDDREAIGNAIIDQLRQRLTPGFHPGQPPNPRISK